MEIPIQTKHVVRLILLIALLAGGTNQNSRNWINVQKSKAVAALNHTAPTASKPAPDKREFLPVGKNEVTDWLTPQDFTVGIGGVGALASLDYIDDYLRWQALPSLWQSGLVYFAEPGPYAIGVKENNDVAMLRKATDNEPDAFISPDGYAQNWGAAGHSRSAESSFGGGSGSGSGIGSSSSGGSGSPRGAAMASGQQGGAAQASGGKNTSTTALSSGAVRAKTGGAPVPSILPSAVARQTLGAIIGTSRIFVAYAAGNNAASVSSRVFANSASGGGGGFVFDVNAMTWERWTLGPAANLPRPVQSPNSPPAFVASASDSATDPLADFPPGDISSGSGAALPVGAAVFTPEPGSWFLVVLGLAGVAILRKRKASHQFLGQL